MVVWLRLWVQLCCCMWRGTLSACRSVSCLSHIAKWVEIGVARNSHRRFRLCAQQLHPIENLPHDI